LQACRPAYKAFLLSARPYWITYHVETPVECAGANVRVCLKWLISDSPSCRSPLIENWSIPPGKAAVEYVLKGLESGALKPVIARQFSFDEMVDVHRYLEKNGQFGKIVVTV
jgi:NADPH:quinone reductase-like Zn-dependent oxidoreductase